MKNNIKLSQEVVIFPEDHDIKKTVEQSILISDDHTWVNIIHDGNEFSMSIENYKALYEMQTNSLNEITDENALTGIQLIGKERKRQIEVEGWTPEHDDKHSLEELAIAGACYAMPGEYRIEENGVPQDWPHYWDSKWWKPANCEFTSDSNYVEERTKELKKAGALIAAEIDRLHRQNKPEEV
jgi:hypothetical protein